MDRRPHFLSNYNFVALHNAKLHDQLLCNVHMLDQQYTFLNVEEDF